LIGDFADLSTVKIVDFGLSAKYTIANGDQHCGTLIYMAPEVALKQEYTKSADVWSIGIIMHEILTGGRHPLFTSEKDTVESYTQKIKDLTSHLDAHKDLSNLARNLF
jgi:serine/threonine protein kinase